MPRPRLPLLLFAALLVLTACEGEGADPPDDAAGFSAQAEEVCQGTRPELDTQRADLFTDVEQFEGTDEEDLEMEPEDIQHTFDRAGALLSTQVTQLRDLEPPADMRQDFLDWLDELEEAAAAYERAGESAEAAESLRDEGDPLLDAERTADGLGLEGCGTEHRTDPDLSPPPEG